VTRRSPYMIELSAQDRAVLEQRARCYTAAHHQVVRAKIVLMAADGWENTQIAARLDTRPQIVSMWRKRDVAASCVAALAAVFVAITLATQYAEAGGFEWGARFFSPLVVPIAALAAATTLSGASATQESTYTPGRGKMTICNTAESKTRSQALM